MLIEICQNIEWSTGERKEFRIVFSAFLDDVLNDIVAKSCGGSFLSLINDDEVPVQIEDFIVLVELAAD